MSDPPVRQTLPLGGILCEKCSTPLGVETCGDYTIVSCPQCDYFTTETAHVVNPFNADFELWLTEEEYDDVYAVFKDTPLGRRMASQILGVYSCG